MADPGVDLSQIYLPTLRLCDGPKKQACRRYTSKCDKGSKRSIVSRTGGLVVRPAKQNRQIHLADGGLKPKAKGTCEAFLCLVKPDLDSKAA